jgi:hypothetical protein
VPDQLVAIVIVVELSAGLPLVGVLGFEYVGFDQTTALPGVTCGSSATGGINLGIPANFSAPAPPPGFDQTVMYTWKATPDTPEHAPGTPHATPRHTTTPLVRYYATPR